MADIIPICQACKRPRYGLQQPGVTHLHCRTCLSCGQDEVNCQCPTWGGRKRDQQSPDGHDPSLLPGVTSTALAAFHGPVPTDTGIHDVADEWEDMMGMGAHVVSGSGGVHSYPSGAPGGAAGSTATKPYVRCDHVQDVVPIGEHYVLVTGGHDIMAPDLRKLQEGKNELVFPDLGVYLDGGWKSKLELDKKRPAYPTEPKFPKIEAFDGAEGIDITDITGDTEKIMDEWRVKKTQYDAALEAYNKGPKEYLWPFMWVDWPDRGIIPVEVVERLVAFVLKQIAAKKVLDVGCAGAHGRTGTLLAMMLIDAEGLTPSQAIRQVRERHCHKAIESQAQVKAIFGYGGLLATEGQAKEFAFSAF